VVWGGVDVNHYHGKKMGVVLKLKRKSQIIFLMVKFSFPI
jgi:hypothetical protein